MNVKELFIYNETYPLPLDKYQEFKTRRDGCVNNPMCMNRLKFDAESFIADWGKKHGAKIENNEESNFTYLKDTDITKRVQENIKNKDNTTLVIIGALVILGVYSIIHKNLSVGAVTILLALLLLMSK